MKPNEVIENLKNQGVIVNLSPEGKLLARAETGEINAAQIALLRECKAGIIALLRESVAYRVSEWQRRGIRFFAEGGAIQVEYKDGLGEWADFQPGEIDALDSLINQHGAEIMAMLKSGKTN